MKNVPSCEERGEWEGATQRYIKLSVNHCKLNLKSVFLFLCSRALFSQHVFIDSEIYLSLPASGHLFLTLSAVGLLMDSLVQGRPMWMGDFDEN